MTQEQTLQRISKSEGVTVPEMSSLAFLPSIPFTSHLILEPPPSPFLRYVVLLGWLHWTADYFFDGKLTLVAMSFLKLPIK